MPVRSRKLRPHLVVALLAAAAASALGYQETHLDEITEPVAGYVTTRLAELDALPSPGKDDKKEAKALGKLAKKLAKPARTLASDFGELSVAAKTAKKLGTRADPMRDALDTMYHRAIVALGERRELVGDHVALISDANAVRRVQKLVDRYNAARAAAESAASDDAHAKALVAAEKDITAALKRAEKDARKAVGNSNGTLSMPPPRLRNGDLVGAGGARIVIPVDEESPLRGVGVLIPAQALAGQQRITIEAADGFVGGRDEPLGDAIALLPLTLTFNQPVRVFVPVTLPPGGVPADLALFAAHGSAQEATQDVTLEPNGTLSGEVTSLGRFQAGRLAPPLGAPSGTYHVQMFAVAHVLDATDTDKSQVRAGVLDQDWTFRADGVGRASSGDAPLVFRQVLSVAPHHVDGTSSSLVGSIDFLWEQVREGRFAFDFPIEGGSASAEGVVSASGDVISFTGRGGAFDFFAVGVRAGTAPTLADLAGRWAAVEIGVELTGAGTEPFATRLVSSFTGFDIDAGAGTLAFLGTGSTFTTTTTYHTDAASALHTRETDAFADGGVESVQVFGDGGVFGDMQQRRGWANADAGVLVTARKPSAGGSVTLLVAVRRPAGGGASVSAGDYEVARLGLSAAVENPLAPRSSLAIDPAIAQLTLDGAGSATLVFEPVTRATYTLEGLPPLADITWSLAAATTAATPPDATFAFTPDAAGDVTGPTLPTWYAVSADGSVLLGATPGEAVREERGILIGLR